MARACYTHLMHWFRCSLGGSNRVQQVWFSLQNACVSDSSSVLLVCRAQVEAQEQQVQPDNWW
jgi:hypothetical protein